MLTRNCGWGSIEAVATAAITVKINANAFIILCSLIKD
jgi:hypothetical protein